MSERPRDPMLDHEYDGIREFDNPCPAWWNWIFLGTFVFSLFYFVFFHIAPYVGTNGWSMAQAFDATVAANLQLQFGEIGELTVDEATISRYRGETKWLAAGKAVYLTHCKPCHAENGSGNVGPNLTDDLYKNVKSLGDIAAVIEQGAANGSMPAWKNRLVPNEIVLVSAYVANLRGQHLSGPRGAEGQRIPPWPEAPTEQVPTEQAPGEQTAGQQAAGSGAVGPPQAETPTTGQPPAAAPAAAATEAER